MKLLHLDSSIKGEGSVSRIISAAIVEKLRLDISDLDVTYRDLAADPLDHLTLASLGGAEAAAVLDQFLETDIVVIGAGLYNFTVPSQLKAWIDRILIAGRTFRYGQWGPEGLAGGKRVIVALARGGNYAEGSPIVAFEHGETLLRTALGFIGIHDQQYITADGISLSEESRSAALEAALAQVSHIEVERATA